MRGRLVGLLLCVAGTAPAAPSGKGVFVGVGGLASEQGCGVYAQSEIFASPVVVSIRGAAGLTQDSPCAAYQAPYAEHDAFEGTVLVGLAPNVTLTAKTITLSTVVQDKTTVTTEYVDRSGNVLGRESHVESGAPRQTGETYTQDVTAASGWGIFGGARVNKGGFEPGLRWTGILSARRYFGTSLGSAQSVPLTSFELGVTYTFAGQESPFLHHMTAFPGGYARVDFGIKNGLFGTELGLTGAAYRNAHGELTPEILVRVFMGVSLDWGSS